jgi:hypothetical protein
MDFHHTEFSKEILSNNGIEKCSSDRADYTQLVYEESPRISDSEDEIYGDSYVEGLGQESGSQQHFVGTVSEHLLVCSRGCVMFVDHSSVLAVTQTLWSSVRGSLM